MQHRYPQRTWPEFRSAIDLYRGNQTRLMRLLFAALHARCMPAIKAILAEGVSVDAVDTTQQVPGLIPENLRRPTRLGLCALAVAGRLGGNANDLKIAHWLLEQGASPTGPGTILLCRVELLDLFLEGGADIDARGENYNPLLYAIEVRTKQDKSLALIEAGADLTIADPRGATPLHCAIMNGRKDTAQALLQAGADRYAVDQEGCSPFRVGVQALAELHFQTDSNICATRSVLHSLRDELPAQPEDLFLSALAFDDPESLQAILQNRPGWMNEILPGPPGPFGIDMQDLMQSKGLIDGIAFGLELTQTNETPWPFLSWAVLLNAARCVRWMVASGADPDIDIAGLPSPRQLSTRHHVKKQVRDALQNK